MTPISVMILDVLLTAVLPFKNTDLFWVYWFQEALSDVNHASQKRALRRPTIVVLVLDCNNKMMTYDQELLTCMKLERVTKVSPKALMFMCPR